MAAPPSFLASFSAAAYTSGMHPHMQTRMQASSNSSLAMTAGVPAPFFSVYDAAAISSAIPRQHRSSRNGSCPCSCSQCPRSLLPLHIGPHSGRRPEPAQLSSHAHLARLRSQPMLPAFNRPVPPPTRPTPPRQAAAQS
ncbi:hypothetical protein L1887_48613 [Cichorium endivia]|nr:hypothetical protein L1887_48613 [Cichorium endivia]